MKNFLLFIILLVCAVGAAYGQARTAAQIQEAPFSQLTPNLPPGSVRTCINCQSNNSTGVCELGSSQMAAQLLNGLWKCTKYDPGDVAGVSSITGTANMVIASGPTGAVTLSLPQFIGTSNNVSFGSVTGTTFLSTPGYLRFVESAAPSVSTSGTARFYMDSTSHTVKFSQHGGAYFNVVPSGLLTASGLTMSTARLLGRTTAATGAIEEISIGTGLSFTGGVLSNTTSGGTVTGTGSTGTVPVWSSSTGIGDSSITDGTAVQTTKAFTAAGAITSLGTVTGVNVTTSSAGDLLFGSRSRIRSSVDGKLTLTNAAANDFTQLFFKTSSGPNIQISGVEFKFNDGSGSSGTANIYASQFSTSGTGSGTGGFTSANVDGAVTIVAQHNSGIPYTPWTLSLPLNDGAVGECLQTDGSGITSWGVCGGSSGANTALSNLASVAINTSLLPATAGAIDAGSATKPFGFLWFAGSSGTPATNNFKLIGASTSGTRTADFPDSNTLIPIMSQRLTFTGPSAPRSYAIADASTTIGTAAAALTSTALVTGGGAGLLQTPSATAVMDTSGNISTPGTMSTGVGGGVAGNVGLGQGTASAVAANTIQFQAPTSVTGYNFVFPSAAGSGLLQWTNSANVMTGTLSTLTSGRVPVATTNGLLTDDSDLTFATDTLTVTKIVGSTSITDTGLTSGRVTLASTAGLLADDSDLTFSGSTLTATNLAVTTAATVGGKTVSVTVASGTSALGTSAITSGTCASAVTTSATGTATTDVIWWGFNGDPTGVTGYAPTANGMLTIIAYPSADNVNYKVCNNTNASVTPGAITLNWRVIR